jgi:double-stranded uracil-DNA glycosylase
MSPPPPRRLRDVIAPRTRVLYVGINPGLRSAAMGHHFAGVGNPFWRLLFAARLIPRPLTYEEDRRLAQFGCSLTNLCPRPTRAAAELTKAEMAAGRRVLERKVARLQPAVVVLVGLSLYQSIFGLPKSGGPGPKPERIADARVFVVPNPSGLNASFPGFDSKLVWFRALARYLDGLRVRRPRDRYQPPVPGPRASAEATTQGRQLAVRRRRTGPTP